MNQLLKSQINFLCLLMSTNSAQQKAMIKTILPTQMKALVQIVYNVLVGNRELSDANKKKLRVHKTMFRCFVGRELSFEKRKEILLKYFRQISILVNTVAKELQ